MFVDNKIIYIFAAKKLRTMWIKKSESAIELAKSCGKSFAKMAAALTESLLEHDFVVDEPCCWGEPLSALMDKDTPISVLNEMIVDADLPSRHEVVKLLLAEDFILIGDGDCPECGAEMEVFDCDEYQHDYDSPIEYRNITYHCPNCGAEKFEK